MLGLGDPSERIMGRYSAMDLEDPETGELLVGVNEEIDDTNAAPCRAAQLLVGWSSNCGHGSPRPDRARRWAAASCGRSMATRDAVLVRPLLERDLELVAKCPSVRNERVETRTVLSGLETTHDIRRHVHPTGKLALRDLRSLSGVDQLAQGLETRAKPIVLLSQKRVASV